LARDPLLSGLLRGFVSEAEELSERVAREVLELERNVGEVPLPQDRYDVLARGLHTLKGSAGSLGLKDLSQLAHRMEDIVAPLRVARAPVPQEVADALLRGLDLFMVRVRAHAAESALADVAPVMDRLFARVESGAGAALHSRGVSIAPREAPTRADDEEARDLRVDVADVMGLMHEVERLREVRLRLDERRGDVERALDILRSAEEARDVEAKAALVEISRVLRADATEAADIVDALESRVKSMGTEPFRTVIDPLHRAVRDLCRDAGKEAKLSMVGGEVSLDRRVLSSLKEALQQLVRNAIDHGIESPEEREALGKHRQGSLVVRVEQQGNVVFVEVSDDGRGLDLVRIREAAVVRGLLRADEAESTPTDAVQRLIFSSGLSTRDVVSETSGRGLGMNIVREQIAALRGRIEVESRSHEGTRFMMTLPIELGSTLVLVVRCAEQEVGVPMMAIERLVAAPAMTFARGPGEMILPYGDESIRVVDVGALLGLRQPTPPSPGQPLLVMQASRSRIALAVDEVVGDRELAIRALPRELALIPAFQGASTTARGEVLLILRPDWLASAPSDEASHSRARRALVVDDSLTARALHRAMLEAGGYAVHAVSSGAVALEWLARSRYDVIVSDVAMESMDGFAFAAILRERAETRRTPLILVSGRNGEEDRARALEAGADAFLSKEACTSGGLLEEVSRILSQRKSAA
jgi:chemotaxis protein histidine kinase CheA/ActR/RegA family two-component response regulator